MKHKLKCITIRRAEGPIQKCQERKFPGFLEAHSWLRYQGESAPKPGNGYDKCDFLIEWENGDTYQGRFDLQFGGRDSDETLFAHVQNHIKFYAGLRRPDRYTEEQYREMIRGKVQRALQMLATLEMEY